MLKLMLITNDPELARFAVGHGVDRIFVDLEILGKQARQGHLDTVISCHSIEDVARVRKAVPGTELLVRINPVHDGMAGEVEQALGAGADILMLPMFRSAAELARLAGHVQGRARIMPLVETAEAAADLEQVAAVPGVSEIYIGLNDLHLALGQVFMFQPLADGTLDRMAQILRKVGLPFGFGGVARVGEGRLPAELILGEHLRLGSSSVILSRTFHRHSRGLSDVLDNLDFGREVGKLRAQERALRERTGEQQEADRRRVASLVAEIVRDGAQKQRKG